MINLKLCNNGLSVVGINEKGETVSYLIEAEEYKRWLSEGNTPEPEFTDAELLMNAKEAKSNTIRQAYENALRAMTGNTDPAEMASWTKQEQEARAWIVNNAVVTPIIDNLIIGRAMGESKADLVVKIIIKADAYTVAYAQVLGAYHAKQKAIEVATTVIEVEAI